MRREIVLRDAWSATARDVAERGGRLVALWAAERGAHFAVCAAYAAPEGLRWVELALPDSQAKYPGLAEAYLFAGRMQRAIADLSGLEAEGAADERLWLNHGAWPSDYRPLRAAASGVERFAGRATGDYPFVRVEGEGVHEIPVGPVHAGIIEPGHFRFSVVGEKVLRLEERLGYVHKGIEKRFEGMTLDQGYRLAGRVSGDSTVAYAWAYAQALEAMLGAQIPPRALALRALCLERERIANHLGDLGYLGNDAGFAFGLAQFSRLKEDVLRSNLRAFGHRMLMDCIAPGGIAREPSASALGEMAAQCDAIESEVRQLRNIYDEHAGVQDRFRNCGIATAALARQLGLAGLAGRASGRARDLRVDFPTAPYDAIEVVVATRSEGDVAARAAVRFDEVFESLRLCRALLATMPDGNISTTLEDPAPNAFGIGYVEGWRGPVFVALDAGPGGTIRRCHPHDVSWQNWPVLEHAVIGNIVPDFPLINKSFNLSYSGHDL